MAESVPGKRSGGQPRNGSLPVPAAIPASNKTAALQAIENLRSTSRAFRDERSKRPPASPTRVYQECRKIARICSPDMMWVLALLACTSEDERVRMMSAIAVLDRAGVKPLDYDPDEETRELQRLPLEERKARLIELINKATELVAKEPARGLVAE